MAKSAKHGMTGVLRKERSGVARPKNGWNDKERRVALASRRIASWHRGTPMTHEQKERNNVSWCRIAGSLDPISSDHTTQSQYIYLSLSFSLDSARPNRQPAPAFLLNCPNFGEYIPESLVGCIAERGETNSNRSFLLTWTFS